jgi:hypothetical protein
MCRVADQFPKQVELWQVYRSGYQIETVERLKPTVLPSLDKSHGWTLLCELLGFKFQGMDRFWCAVQWCRGAVPDAVVVDYRETWSSWSQLVQVCPVASMVAN